MRVFGSGVSPGDFVLGLYVEQSVSETHVMVTEKFHLTFFIFIYATSVKGPRLVGQV